MGQVTALLNSIGWTLPVLPELDDLTVGKYSTFMAGSQQKNTGPLPYSRIFFMLATFLFGPEIAVLHFLVVQIF